MFYIVIDIVKLNHFVSDISLEGKISIDPFKFTNSTYNFTLLASKLNLFDKTITITSE